MVWAMELVVTLLVGLLVGLAVGAYVGRWAAWGEVQLRRVLEHAGLLARCDFDEQVSRVSRHQRQVRPDVVVRLPGDKYLVVDSKAPMGAFLAAQADDLPASERTRLLRDHA